MPRAGGLTKGGIAIYGAIRVLSFLFPHHCYLMDLLALVALGLTDEDLWSVSFYSLIMLEIRRVNLAFTIRAKTFCRVSTYLPLPLAWNHCAERRVRVRDGLLICQ